MLALDIGPGVGGEMDDIESELCCSAREASGGYAPFVDLDLAMMVRTVGDSRMGLDRMLDKGGGAPGPNRLYRASLWRGTSTRRNVGRQAEPRKTTGDNRLGHDRRPVAMTTAS